MNQQYPSNNPWATYLQPEFHPQRDYYNDESERFHSRRYQHNQPPAYEDVFSQTYPSAPLPGSKAAFDSTAVNARYSSDTSRYSRSPSNAGSDGILEQALEFTQGGPPSKINHRRLRLPISIPQVVPGLGQPFSRGYSPELRDRGVSMEEFVRFIDNLNVVSSGSPPLQVVDLDGGVVGMVPIHHAQLISLGIQAVAKAGKAAVSKTRGSMFLSKANAEFFNPRGLRVELVTTDALKVKLRMGSNAILSTNSHASDDRTVFERRVAALQGYAAPVTFNVPPPDEQTLDVMHLPQAHTRNHTVLAFAHFLLSQLDSR